MAIAGHVSPKMLAHYSHVRLEAKRKALEALCQPTANVRGSAGMKQPEKGVGEGSYDTSYGTNVPATKSVPPEVIERNGRHEETRTPDLYRVNLALFGFTTTYKHVEVA
jgi:hypothetical protein